MVPTTVIRPVNVMMKKVGLLITLDYRAFSSRTVHIGHSFLPLTFAVAVECDLGSTFIGCVFSAGTCSL